MLPRLFAFLLRCFLASLLPCFLATGLKGRRVDAHLFSNALKKRRPVCKNGVQSEGQFYRRSITLWKGFDCRPLFRTREILFDGSSAILASAIKVDVEW